MHSISDPIEKWHFNEDVPMNASSFEAVRKRNDKMDPDITYVHNNGQHNINKIEYLSHLVLEPMTFKFWGRCHDRCVIPTGKTK
jgi:hypothetical protein